MVLRVSDELGSDDVFGVQQGAVLDKKTAAASSCGHACKPEEEHSGARRLTKHLRHGAHVLAGYSGAVLPRLQLHTNAFG